MEKFDAGCGAIAAVLPDCLAGEPTVLNKLYFIYCSGSIAGCNFFYQIYYFCAPEKVGVTGHSRYAGTKKRGRRTRPLFLF
jgi:hypothetical protein